MNLLCDDLYKAQLIRTIVERKLYTKGYNAGRGKTSDTYYVQTSLIESMIRRLTNPNNRILRR